MERHTSPAAAVISHKVPTSPTPGTRLRSYGMATPPSSDVFGPPLFVANGCTVTMLFLQPAFWWSRSAAFDGFYALLPTAGRARRVAAFSRPCAPCIFIIPRDLPLPVWASTHLPAARHLGEQQGESVWPSLPSPGFYKGRHSSSSCQAGCLPPPPALHQGERLGDSVWPSLPSPGFYKGRRSSSSCWAGCGVPSTTTWFS